MHWLDQVILIKKYLIQIKLELELFAWMTSYKKKYHYVHKHVCMIWNIMKPKSSQIFLLINDSDLRKNNIMTIQQIPWILYYKFLYYLHNYIT